MVISFIQRPIDYLLVKVAARCNIDCSYCYWFRDGSVYAKPKLMDAAVLARLIERIEEQILAYSLPTFSLLLHGGEPMLWGRTNFDHIAEQCRSISVRTGCAFTLSTTTNGILIDEAWLDCFERNDINVTISIDGPARIHDVRRRTFGGEATHQVVQQAVRLLQQRGIQFGALAVCDPTHHPAEFVDFFQEMHIADFDIMFPDATFDEKPPHVARFYCDLFDIWLKANQKTRALHIRSIEDMVAGLLGGQSSSEGIGYGPQEVCTILTDGSMEPLDVLRIAGDKSTQTAFNIFDNSLEDIKGEPLWRATREASLNLCDKCKQCRFQEPCGGGYLPHRFSSKNGLDNPSAYCDDLYSILSYMQSEIEKHVYLQGPTGDKVSIGQAAKVRAVSARPRDSLAPR